MEAFLIGFFALAFALSCVIGAFSAYLYIARHPEGKTREPRIGPRVLPALFLYRRKNAGSDHTVLAGEYARSLAAANAATRKLRRWGISVSRAAIRGGGKPPVLTLKIEPGTSIAPLLDATEGRRFWLPAGKNAPARAVAALDGCTLKWEMP